VIRHEFQADFQVVMLDDGVVVNEDDQCAFRCSKSSQSSRRQSQLCLDQEAGIGGQWQSSL
jgi:hypothetical protein